MSVICPDTVIVYCCIFSHIVVYMNLKYLPWCIPGSVDNMYYIILFDNKVLANTYRNVIHTYCLGVPGSGGVSPAPLSASSRNPAQTGIFPEFPPGIPEVRYECSVGAASVFILAAH